MAANWLSGWIKSTRGVDKQVRRKQLRLDVLEDRAVPATAVAITDATSAPPLDGHDAETTVSINPTDTLNILAGANGDAHFAIGEEVIGVTATGAGPYQAVQIPNTPGGSPIGDMIFDHFSDGRALVTKMEFDGANPGTIGIISSVSNDGGLTWQSGAVTPIGTGSDKNEQGIGPDVANLGVDRAYATWHDGNVIQSSSSLDGLTWSAPVAVSPDGGNIFSSVAIDSQGIAYIIWDDFSTAGQSNIRISRSVDGGATWSAEGTVATSLINIFQDTTPGGTGGNYEIPAHGPRGITALGNIDVDRSGGPNDGRLYVVFNDQDRDEAPGAGRHNDTDIYLTFSDDGGLTWSAPAKVNDGNSTNSTFFPRVAVDQSSGNVAVGWYDARNGGAQNTSVEFWGAVSDPGGTSFTANFQFSQGQSTNMAQVSPGFGYGDYSGLSFENGVIAAAWADNSNSGGENPAGAGGEADTYVRTFAVGAAGPGGRSLVAFDLSKSMVSLYGLDINDDGVVDELDDFNQQGLEGSLIDLELFDYFSNQGGTTGIIAFARRAETLNMTPDGQKFTTAGADSDGDGDTDVLETLRSLTKGEGGYFGTVDVEENPTLYEGVLANILLYASPGDNVTIYTDGGGRLDANSANLQALAQAGISVNVVLVGPYQDIAPTTDAERIANVTGGQIRRLTNLNGRPADGGFPSVVAGGGVGGLGGGTGSFNPGFGGGQIGGGTGGGGGGSGGAGGSGGGSGTGGGGGTGGDGGAGASGDPTGDGSAPGVAAAAANPGATTTVAEPPPVVTHNKFGMLVNGQPAFVPFKGEDGYLYKWVFMRNQAVTGPIKMRVDSRGLPVYTRPSIAPPAPRTDAGGLGSEPTVHPWDFALPTPPGAGTLPQTDPGQGSGTGTSVPPTSDTPTSDPPANDTPPATGDETPPSGDDGANTGATGGGSNGTGGDTIVLGGDPGSIGGEDPLDPPEVA